MSINRPKYIIIHHSAVSRKVQPFQFDPINTYHKQEFNFKSQLGYWGGYHYLIEPSGLLKQYRGEHEEGAHTIGHNLDSIGICLSGNFSIEYPTAEQVTMLKALIARKMIQYNIPRQNIVPHRYFATYTAKGQPFRTNISSFKTFDGCQPYKDCCGKLLPDGFLPMVEKTKLGRLGAWYNMKEDVVSFFTNLFNSKSSPDREAE